MKIESVPNIEHNDLFQASIEKVSDGVINFNILRFDFEQGWNLKTVDEAFNIEAALLREMEPETPVLFSFDGTPTSNNLFVGFIRVISNPKPINLGKFYYSGNALLRLLVHISTRAASSVMLGKWETVAVSSIEEAIHLEMRARKDT